MTAQPAAEYEWSTVSEADAPEETKIVFEEIGDEFVGKFLGYRQLSDRDSGQNYSQARFEKDGELYFCRANHSMRAGLDQVRPQTVVKITYASDVDTGQASPMRGFTVQTARTRVVSRAKPTQRANAAGKS